MKFTLSWLKDHLDTDADLGAIADRLTMIGMELEGVQDRAAAYAPFKLARVVSAEPHPNADRLRVCMVDAGDGKPLQVVCGAPNARAGMVGVFAPAGSVVPGTGLELKKSAIRGVESNGMLVSEREMGLSEEHDGIIDLPADAPVGTPFADYMGLGDPVIDVSITPNRADCLGVRGIARDLAASGLGRLKPLNTAAAADAYASPIGLRVDLPADKAGACPWFAGRHFRGQRNGPSPKWLQDRLKAVGLRPISALVDITNYLSLDLCRPLHVFDAAKLDRNVVVRMGRPGETLAALDGKTYSLDGEMTVIADESRANALGGVMGGEESGCTEATTEVFLEVALFDPIRTAETGRRLGIISDARYRFERGVDPAFVPQALAIASRMILEFCGGEASAPVFAGAEPDWQRHYVLRRDRVRTLAGMDVPAPEQARILQALGFATAETEAGLRAAVPSWRGDVIGEADLVEEVARIHGYDRLPTLPMHRPGVALAPARNASQRRSADVRRALAARGLAESVTFSFMSSAHTGLFGGGDPGLTLINPISADLDAMRPSILPNLLLAAGRNADRGFADSALFEIGPQFENATPEGQRLVAAGVRTGQSGPRHWSDRPRAVDAFDAKADALAVLEAAGAPVGNLQVTTDAPGWFHPGRSGVLRLGPNVLARFGEMHPQVLAALDLRGPVAGFEVFLDRVPEPKRKEGRARPPLRLSQFQAVVRDFAFVVDRDVASDRILRAARAADKALIAGAEVFDVFEGASVGEGRKSVAIAVTLQPGERTLTEAEIAAVAEKIVASVAKQTGAALRG
ncbi:MAG: phenylalanine--tRNA ligase subunit beta [Alphaproteobacteria bacterium]